MIRHTEQELIEQGWAALVERLGLAEANRFIMLLDRRSGFGLRHLRSIQSLSRDNSHPSYYNGDYYHETNGTYHNGHNGHNGNGAHHLHDSPYETF